MPSNYNSNASGAGTIENQTIEQNEAKDESLEEENRQILYSKLVAHENQFHPRIDGKSFGCCAKLGSYGCCGESEVTPLSQQIGVGATMFLLATKSLAWLFFFLTILNIPVYAFYYASNPTSADSRSPQDFFASMSLGNIG